MASQANGKSRRFSLQTLLVWVALCSFLLAVLINRPGYVQDAFIVSVGLYLIHQAWHTRFKGWRGAICVGIFICLIGVASWMIIGSPLQDMIESNRRLREIRDEMRQQQL